MKSRNGAINLRLYSDDYGGDVQAEYMNQEYGRDFYLALLRLDSIMSRRLIISDNQFADSSYFLSRRPSDLAQDLGRDQAPVIVRAREERLGDSLRNILLRPGHDTLNGFEFIPIRDRDARLFLRDELTRTTASELERCFRRMEITFGKKDAAVPARGIKMLLQRKLRDRLSAEIEEDLDFMERGWSWWLEQEGRSFKVECWHDSTAPELTATLGPAPPMSSDIGMQVCAEVRKEVLRGSTYRWDVDRILSAHADRAAQTPEGAADLVALRKWYIQGRHRRFAAQHSCNYGRRIQKANPSVEGLAIVATGESIALARSKEIAPPPEFMALIRESSAEDFRRAMIESSPRLESWWRQGDVKELGRALDSFYKRLDKAGRSSVSWLDFAQLFVNFGAAITAESDLTKAGAASLGLVSMLNLSAKGRSVLQRGTQRARVIEYAQMRLDNAQ